MKNFPDNRIGRIGIINAWMPILIISFIYLVSFILLGGDYPDFQNILVHFLRFILPLLLLFVVHHYVLMRCFYLHGRVRAYIVGLVMLMSAFSFGVWLNDMPVRIFIASKTEQAPPAPHGRPAPKSLPDGKGKPPHDHHHHKGPKKSKGPSPVTMDLIMGMLLLAADYTSTLFRKYAAQRRRSVEIERENLKMQLDYLKAQLNPHFLMNTLNNIHAMVEIDPRKAQEMLIELSRLLRYVLYEGERTDTTLAHEIAFVEDYVSLMRMRHSSRRLSVELDINAPDAQNISLPPLLFIVIIENAFKHGISPFGPTEMSISITTLPGNLLSFVCANTLWPAADKADDAPGGLGLKNLRKRLDLIFGDQYTLVISTDENRFTVSLTIPYHHVTENTMSGS